MNSPELPSSAPLRQATARDFLAVLFRRRALILGLFAVASLTALTIVLSTPVEYISSGRVLLKRGEKESALSPNRRIFSDWEEDMGSEVEVVKSAPVLERARTLLREEAGPGRAPAKLDALGVDVEVKGRTNVMLIGYVDTDPIVAKEVCDALVRSYVEFRQNDFSMAYPRDFFEGELERVQKDLDHWIAIRRNYAERQNVVDIRAQQQSDITQLGTLRGRRTELQEQLAQAETGFKRLNDIQSAETMDQPTLSSTSFGDENSLIAMKQRRVDQEYRVAVMRERFREDAPELVAAVATLDTLRSMLRREFASRSTAMQSRIEMLKAGLAVVERDVAQLESSFAGMPDKELSIAEMDRRIAVLQERYRELSENSTKARITDNTSPTRNIVLLARASTAIARNARDYVRLLLAPAFSLVVGIGLAFFLDGLDTTVRTAHHAEEAIELPVLATLAERRRSRRDDGPRVAERLAS